MSPTLDPDDQPPRETTAEDLNKVFDCWTRIEVLIASTGPRLSVADLAEALGLERPLVSTHLLTLCRDGLAVEEREGKHHYYSLTERASVVCSDAGIDFMLAAMDGSVLRFHIPKAARVMRLFETARRLAMKGRQERKAAASNGGPIIEVRPVLPPKPAPAPKAHAPKPCRRPNEL